MNWVAKLYIQAVSRLSSILSVGNYEHMLVRLIRQRINSLSSADALRLLFKLDAELYSLQGPLAVTYGGGVHTKHRHTGYHDFFVTRVKEGERILDIGCGAGMVAFDLAKKANAIVEGIDLNGESIEKAKKLFSHPNLSFSVQDALTLPPGKEYSVVVLSNVLEHISDRVPFLKRVQKNTKAKRYLIRVPLFERDWRVPLKKELGLEWRLDPDHKTEYTLQSFAKEMEEANLTITHLEVHWGEVWSELVPALN